MDTQNFCTLQVFQSLARKCKGHFLQPCPKEFIRFICDCIVNQLKGNLQAIKRHQVVKFQDEVWLLSLKRTSWKQRRNVLLSEKKIATIGIITPPIINHLCWYGAVCTCPASVYNKSVTTQSFTKQELQKYEAEQPPTYQIGSLNLNKKLFGKADAQTRQNFILFSHQAFKFANNSFGRCWYWSPNLRLYFTFASKKRRRSRNILYFARRCRNITVSSF